MLDSLLPYWQALLHFLGTIPDFVWNALAASVPIVVGARFAVAKIAHERRYDAKLAAYTKLHRAADLVAVHAPGSDQDKEQDRLAAAALSDFFDAIEEVDLHMSARSRTVIRKLVQALGVLMRDASNPESESARLSHRRANLLFKEIPGVVASFARRDLYGLDVRGELAYQVFRRHDKKRVQKVFARVRDDSLASPLPDD